MNDCIVEAYYDGACEPCNPGGHASWGAVISQRGGLIYRDCGYVGYGPKMSSNVAEYSGMIAALNWLLQHGFADSKIIVRGDNRMSILQMRGEWKAKKGLYLDLYARAKALRKRFTNINFEWVQREDNCDADELSKKPLAERGVRVNDRRDHVPAPPC